MQLSDKNNHKLESDRTLTDADVKALAKELTQGFKQEFFSDVGKGLWDLVWKTIIMGLIALAAYGATKGWDK